MGNYQEETLEEGGKWDNLIGGFIFNVYILYVYVVVSGGIENGREEVEEKKGFDSFGEILSFSTHLRFILGSLEDQLAIWAFNWLALYLILVI